MVTIRGVTYEGPAEQHHQDASEEGRTALGLVPLQEGVRPGVTGHGAVICARIPRNGLARIWCEAKVAEIT